MEGRLDSNDETPSPNGADTTSRLSRESEGVPALLRPFVEFVARIKAGLETKLLVGFLGISVLMLTLGIVSLVVVSRMGTQVDHLSALEEQQQRAQEMLYNITAQSHFRTMALLTDEPVWNEKIFAAKEAFTVLLTETEEEAVGDHGGLFHQLTSINERYTVAGIRVDELHAAGDVDAALDVHILSEHEISHELEDLLNAFIRDTETMLAEEIASFSGVRRFLTIALAVFSAMSLAGAIAMGAIISWAVILPVRRIDGALDNLASGDFTSRVDVPNRDEFGKLSQNVNRASEQLEVLYGRLETVNRDLQAKVEEQVAMLDHASQLRRYLSPQVADSVMAGDVALDRTRRAELTIAFIDIRGFTALSEQTEPEAMAASLNRFLTEMTDIVFEHGGTLDKYVGDAIMVFFNDPLSQPDHAERGVRMAVQMRDQLDSLRRELAQEALSEITAGVGISTGFVTVGNFGSPSRIDYTVIGNHVNLASRLADQAAAGEILIAERTLALLPPDLVSVEPAGERTLKGVTRPIKLYRVVDLVERIEPAPAEATETTS